MKTPDEMTPDVSLVGVGSVSSETHPPSSSENVKSNIIGELGHGDGTRDQYSFPTLPIGWVPSRQIVRYNHNECSQPVSRNLHLFRVNP